MSNSNRSEGGGIIMSIEEAIAILVDVAFRRRPHTRVELQQAREVVEPGTEGVPPAPGSVNAVDEVPVSPPPDVPAAMGAPGSVNAVDEVPPSGLGNLSRH